MNEITIGVIGIIILMGLFLTGMEMAVGMTIVGFVGYAILVSPHAAMQVLANDYFDSLESYSFTVVPLFVLMGQVAFNAGVARRLFDCAHKFLGHIPGGLALATVAGATIFKAICGSIVATSATFASVAVPEMDRFGYAKEIVYRYCCYRGNAWCPYPAQRNPHPPWNYYAAIYRQTFSGRSSARLNDRRLFRRNHPGLGTYKSRDRPGS